MNLINGIHHSCEMREYAFMILREYTINFPRHIQTICLPFTIHVENNITDCYMFLVDYFGSDSASVGIK